MKSEVVASVAAAAFNCPHCGAFASQKWYSVAAAAIARLPAIHSPEDLANVRTFGASLGDTLVRTMRISRPGYGSEPFLGLTRRVDEVVDVENLHLSECFHCKKLAVWAQRQLVSPSAKSGPASNDDLPDEIRRDYEEARSIVGDSPRGAAALLRLCVQKLCKHLGESGSDINKDIGSLVTKGLDPTVQKALDIVRVIGNESVHPGELDLRDDQETALLLFELINAIADRMITHPKKVEAIYSKLPEKKLQGIMIRDAKANGSTT
ncbi:DUF4145 domain-containing protein [Mitsuaria sp. GD03876]|uniref:DUF4145 domain-containing protein n=1 Tax=Mitsuaria sp. GD03876 TaxID=2975399 RepID=UPI002446ECAA|nr:DUF4145 domain-containing protein [Mitsuaria sp. GD03876]MDH0865615.1 DUF4145 domain-containing protein [Mitsuaria sp. GD03876]